MTKWDAICKGEYMSLEDSQIKPFRSEQQDCDTLFNYSVEISADPKLLLDIYNRSSIEAKMIKEMLNKTSTDDREQSNSETNDLSSDSVMIN